MAANVTKAAKVGSYRGGTKSAVGGRGGFLGKTTSGGNLGRSAMSNTGAQAAAKGYGKSAGDAYMFGIGATGSGVNLGGGQGVIDNTSGAGVGGGGGGGLASGTSFGGGGGGSIGGNTIGSPVGPIGGDTGGAVGAIGGGQPSVDQPGYNIGPNPVEVTHPTAGSARAGGGSVVRAPAPTPVVSATQKTSATVSTAPIAKPVQAAAKGYGKSAGDAYMKTPVVVAKTPVVSRTSRVAL